MFSISGNIITWVQPNFSWKRYHKQKSPANQGLICNWSRWWDSNSWSSAPKADAVTKLRYISNIGAPDKIRTRDPQIRSLLLYPAELLAHNSLLFHRAPINNITSTKSWQANNRDFLRVLEEKEAPPLQQERSAFSLVIAYLQTPNRWYLEE